jgi:uncharacterized protein YfiM (DUF2279 family)
MPMQWWAKPYCVFFLFCFSFSRAEAQDSTHRLRNLIIGESVVYSGGMVALYGIWYKDHPRTSMHGFNDWPEWNQMDKAGHFTTGFLVSDFSYRAYRYAGLSEGKSILIGSAQSLFFLTSLEVLDGFSEGWGFSWSDMGFNVLGCSAFALQQWKWNEINIRPKFSAWLTDYAAYRPALLGNDFSSRILKDYNGQTYWLSISSALFFPEESSFPKWLCLSFGYGADGMTGGRENPLVNEAGQVIPMFERERQFYLSLDIDLDKIPTNRKWLRRTLSLLNWIKMPFPTLEVTKKGMTFHPFYF